MLTFFRNQKGGESEKWGRLISHAGDVLVLCFYDAEFVSSSKRFVNPNSFHSFRAEKYF